MSIHWANAVPLLWLLALPLFVLAVGGYTLLALREKAHYVGYGEPGDRVDGDGDHAFAFDHSLPFLVLVGASVGLVRT